VYDVKHKSAKADQKLSRKQAEDALNLSNAKIASLKTLIKASPKSFPPLSHDVNVSRQSTTTENIEDSPLRTSLAE
jgi:hypothetical protein